MWVMKKIAVIVGAALLVGLIAALIIPMWVATAGVGLSGSGNAAIVLMVIFCFGIGGGLMFLVFYSARKGYDDAVDQGATSKTDRLPDDPPPN